ncbi:MAG TPA: response regulator [Gemmatimonadales bacterium]|nr:response regulator [Gemmatimonadales bacterium]
MTTSLRRIANLGLGSALGMLLVVGSVSYWSVSGSLAAARNRRHAYEARGALSNLLIHLEDAESGERGYVLTGDSSYLVPYLRMVTAAERDLDQLHAIADPDTAVMTQLASLRPAVHAALLQFGETIARRTSGNPAAPASLLGGGSGDRPMDSIRSSAQALDSTLTRRTEQLETRVRVSGRVARITIVAGAFLAIALVLISRRLFARHVADRDRAEAELQRSRSFLDSVIEQIPHMVFIKNASDLRFVRINRSGEELLGFSREELLGKSDFDFFPETEARFFVEKDREVLARGTVLDIPEELIHTRHKGSRILHTKKVPVLDADGRPQFLLGVSDDITELRQAAEALRAAETRLHQVLAFSSTVIYAVDVRPGKLIPTFVSDNFTRMTGYDAADALDPGWVAARFHPDERERLLSETPPLLAQDRFTREYRFLFRDGTYHWMRDEARVLRNAAGAPVQILGAWLDITERVRAEEELRRARAAAETANRTKSDFLAKMSHELRTPLNSIIGFSEMLEDETFGTLNEKQHRYVENVLASGRLLLQVINDILDLSKVEAGRMELALAQFEVAQALDEVRALMESLVERKHHTMEVDVEPGLPSVVADPAKFRQIAVNLLSNAIKFTPDGGRIRITARRPPGEPVIEVAVTDTGIGIAPEDTRRIFREFEQLDSEYVREQQGTGLGLALTKKLVELHGGRIHVESEPDRGSTFRFYLPLRAQPSAMPPPPPAAPQPEVRAEQGPLVLVVEDDPRAGDLLGHFLAEAGYRVVHASSGSQAVALARTLKPDAITLDILLPGEDGMAILGQLKGASATRAIPVVVVSITDHRELGLSLGAVEWLVKPVQRDDFVTAVRRSMGAVPVGHTPTVLVVDDEAPTVELLTETLNRNGMRALSATDGRTGVELALAHLPDVIVLDLVMPGMTGFQVVRQLRDHPAGRNIPILVFTGKELTADDRARLLDGVQAVVRKDGAAELLMELARVCPATRQPAA